MPFSCLVAGIDAVSGSAPANVEMAETKFIVEKCCTISETAADVLQSMISGHFALVYVWLFPCLSLDDALDDDLIDGRYCNTPTF